MKSYEDIAERVFEKGDEILKRRQKRTALIRKTSLIVSQLCAVVLICFGIWKTGDMQISMNHDFPDTVITESESTADFSVTAPVSTSKNNDDIIYTSKTVAVSEPNAVTAVFSTGSAPENIALNTSVPDDISSAQLQTSVKSAETQRQLTKRTTFQMQTTLQTVLNTTEMPIPIQTTVCTTVQTENEGSIYMKKLTAFCTSAIVIAASAAPMIGNAEYKVDESRYWRGEKAIFAQMESGELDVDINGNGEFDVFDGFMLKCYLTPNQNYYDFDAETTDRIEAIADYDGNGKVDNGDMQSLVRYFIVSGNLKREHLDYTYYNPEYIYDETKFDVVSSYVHGYLRGNMEALLAGYYIVADMYENGMIDLDFNQNGCLDVVDLYDFYVYTETFSSANPLLTKSYISNEEWYRCDEAFQKFPFYITADMTNARYYVTLYFTGHMELKPEYFTKEYYIETIPEYKEHTCGFSLETNIEKAAVALGIKSDEDAWMKYDKDVFYDLFNAYCNDVESGLRPAPDVNMDGVVDLNDYFVVNTYFSELINEKTVENSILSAEIWYNINENFDFNGNGTTKDIYDILMVQMYVIKYTDTTDFNEAYDRYKASCKDDSTLESESLSYERKTEILAEIESKTVYGDANCDGKVDIADAALILQFLTNKDEYQITNQGMINADCCNPGDGLTAEDSLAVQKLDAHEIESLPVTIE